jgi:MSHA biogenesis protein MshO
MRKTSHGFTLVELIVVMVVTGVLAGILVVFFRPAMQNYLAAGRRAELTDMADTSMRRITRDIRLAVPNSVRLINNGAIEMIPTSMGGRYRMAADSNWDALEANDTRPLDVTQGVSTFDVLTPMPVRPAAGDFVVIGNMDPSEVYAANSPTRAPIANAAAAPAPTASPTHAAGTARIGFVPDARFPAGYDGGRFFIVPAAQRAVSYVCQGVTAAGGGTLFRVSNYGFNAIAAVPNTNGAAILATNVSACQFGYTPGTTQERGLATIVLSLTRDGETVTLSYSTHVSNVP